MRQRGTSGLWALAATVMLAGAALAQGSGSGPGRRGGAGAAALLRMSAVQNELKLTDDQKSKLTALLRRLRAEQRVPSQESAPLSPEQRQQRLVERQASEQAQIGALLTGDQQQRLRQLEYQQQGAAALLEPAVVAALNLSEEQRGKVQAALQEQGEGLRALFAGGPGAVAPEAARQKFEALRKQTDEKAQAALTPEQRQQWQAMLGTPFAFPAAAFAGPGGGRPPEEPPIPAEPPPPIATPAADRTAIHGPAVTGTTPGRPFLFLIPAAGRPPLTFSARGLPAGLRLDPHTGILTGALVKAGTYRVALTVRGPGGRASRTLTIVGGEHRLALTPPMGWNSWNVWGPSVDAEKVRAAADGLVKSGLAAHGYRFINIDDAWEAGRDSNGEIQPNGKFPDMKVLADYVHSKGLKLGIYSSPGPETCGGYEGSYSHEAQDARTYARWGIDYLKYDWCSYNGVARDRSLPELQKPYATMRAALDNCGRDIVFSLCQYGMGSVWEWGAGVGGNLWRTTGDIRDSWSSMARIGFGQDGHEKYAGPGHWNDPDMLVVGRLGWGPNPHPSRLTPNEQITHISLWSLLAAPLLIGCDLTQLDPFTVSLLTNDEVLAVDQDPLGRPAGRRAQQGEQEVWARPLADGTTAVGLFNRGREAATVTASWSDLGLSGRQPVRDLWLQKDLGAFQDQFATRVPAHGTVLVKIGRPHAVTLAYR